MSGLQIDVFPWTTPSSLRALRAARGRKLTVRLRAPSSLEFTIPGDDPEASVVEDQVTDAIVRYKGTDLFWGRCGFSQDSLGPTGYTVQYPFIDYRGVLQSRFMTQSNIEFYTQRDQGDIAWSMIQKAQARTNGNYGITLYTGSDATGIKRDRAIVGGEYVGKEIQSIADLNNGFDWDITPDKKFRVWYPKRGTTTTVFAEYGKTITEVTRTSRGGPYANSVRATGSQELTPVERTHTNILTDPRGIWDYGQGFPDIKVPDTLTARAEWMRDFYGDTSKGYAVKFAQGFWTGPSHFWVGDTISIRIKRGRINEAVAVRIYEMGLEDTGNGIVIVRAQLGKP